MPTPPSTTLFSTMECCVGTPSEASVEMFIMFVPSSGAIGLSGRNSGGRAVPPQETCRPWPIDKVDTLFMCTSVTLVFSFEEMFIVE